MTQYNRVSLKRKKSLPNKVLKLITVCNFRAVLNDSIAGLNAWFCDIQDKEVEDTGVKW